MSLINEMLKDLDNRPRKIINAENVLHDLKSTFTHELKRNQKYYFVIGALIAILIFMCLFIAVKKHHYSATKAKLLLINKNVIQKAIKIPIIQNTGLTMLTGVALQMQQDMTYLRFLLNQNALYKLNSDTEHHQLTIIFDNTQLLAALPKVNYKGSGIEDIQAFKDENNNLKIVLQLNPNTDVKRLALDQSGKAPELQLDLFYKNKNVSEENLAIANTSIPVSIKRPVAESVTQEQYQRAMLLYSKGLYDEAIDILRSVISSVPDQHEGRELLATLLLKQNMTKEASTVIDEGLEQQPIYPIFAELKAQLLLKENNVNKAISILEKYAPSIEANPKYHAFIAALYQRQGKTNLAANLYKQLLDLDPKNAKWWLGLGVTQESLGNTTAAVEAYNNADAIGGLSPETKAYVDTRIHTG